MHGYIETNTKEVSISELLFPPANGTSLYKIKSISLFIFDFAFTSNLFPVFTGLKNKTNKECVKAASWAVLIAGVIFCWLGWTTLLLFGDPTPSHVNFMANVNLEYHMDPTFWESFVIRIAYITLLFCHIPLIFYNGKEAILIIIDEIDRRSCSQALELRMEMLEKVVLDE